MTDPLGWALIGVALAGWLVLFVIVAWSLVEYQATVAETPDDDPRGGVD